MPRFAGCQIQINTGMRYTKDVRLQFALAVLTATLMAVPANDAVAQFGVAAGANFEDLGDLDALDARATFDRATGYHVGLFFNLGAGRVSVQPGVYFRDFGEVKLVEDGRFRELALTSIEVPVDVRIKLVQASALAPYVFAGPVVGFSSTTDDSFQDALRELNVSANIGGGVELSLPGSDVAVIPEIRFARSITRFFRDGETFDIAGADFTPVEVSPQNAVMLRVGLRF